jgi:hypothetical protein
MRRRPPILVPCVGLGKRWVPEILSEASSKTDPASFPRQFWELLPQSSEPSADVAEGESEDKIMAATTTTGFPISACSRAVLVSRAHSSRRLITPQAGRALEILAHAIEYLTDEFVHQGLDFSEKNEQLQAVQVLMALNRQVYFECPESPSFGERCCAFFGRHSK